MKGIIVDCREKKIEQREDDTPLPPPPLAPELPMVDLALVQKLLYYARKMGWI